MMETLSTKPEGSYEDDTRTQGLQLLTYLFTKQDKELVSILKKNPNLISHEFRLYCHMPNQKDPCGCCYAFETLFVDLDQSQRRKELTSLINSGMCSHISEYHRQQIDPSNYGDSSVSNLSNTWDKEALEIHDKTQQLYPELDLGIFSVRTGDSSSLCFQVLTTKYNDRVAETCACKAGILPLHIAVVLGHRKVIKLINSYDGSISKGTLWYSFHSCMLAVNHGNSSILKTTLMYNNYIKTNEQLAFKRRQLDDFCTFIVNENLCQFLLEKSAVSNKHAVEHVLKRKAIEMQHCTHIKYLFFKKAKYYQKHLFFEWLITQYRGLFKEALLNENVLTILLQSSYKYICAPLFLYQAVLMDKSKIALFILKTVRKEYLKKSCMISINFISRTSLKTAPMIVLATINNSVEMLKLLLNCKVVDKHKTFGRYSALTWAEVLGYHGCSELLRTANVEIDMGVTKPFQAPPFVALFTPQLEFPPETYEKIFSVLISRGYDVNSRSANGISPLDAVMKSSLDDATKRCCFRALLFAGADPFAGRTLNFGHQLICELIYVNVDFLRNRADISLIRKQLFEHNSIEIPFLLKCAHTVPPNDRKLLSTVHERSNISQDIQFKIDRFFTQPKTLKHLSKNVIRKHYGIHLHQFMTTNCLPTTLKSYVLLEDILENMEL